MATRLVEFDVASLLKLLTHYSEGAVPLEAEVRNVQISRFLPRWIALVVDSPSWEGTPFEKGDGYNGIEPLHVRYEGKRICVIDNLKDPIAWSDENEIEAPKRQ